MRDSLNLQRVLIPSLGGVIDLFMTLLEGVPLSVPSVPYALSIVPPLEPESTYGVSSALSTIPLFVQEFSYGVPSSLSMVPLVVLTWYSTHIKCCFSF